MDKVWFLLLLLFIAGCSHRNADTPVITKSVNEYTVELASSLFENLSAPEGKKPQIAVATFLPVSSFSLDNAEQEELQFANQLAESMIAQARQYGLIVYDYRLREQLLLKEKYESALSRQLADITQFSQADAILSGTYTVTEQGVIVNARVISITSKQVLAAGSTRLPADILWSQQQVIKRGNSLYRNSATGVTP